MASSSVPGGALPPLSAMLRDALGAAAGGGGRSGRHPIAALCRRLSRAGGAAFAALLEGCAADLGLLPPAGGVAGVTAAAGLAVRTRWLVDAAWERLHTGHWANVPPVWRDAYTLACLLHAAAAADAAATAGAAPAPAAAAAAPPPAPPTAAGLLRQLDRGAMMGGPVFAAPRHAAIGALHAAAAAEAAAAAAARRPPAGRKRPREEDVEAAEEGAPASGWGGGGEVRLPAGSLCGAGAPLRVLQAPDLDAFYATCMAPPGGRGGVPALLAGTLEHWPALARWADPAYLKRVAGQRTVPVEVGAHYLAPGWGTALLTLADFIDAHMAPPAAGAGAQQAQAAGEPPPAAAGAGEPPPAAVAAPAPPLAYLAQHALFEQVPALRADIATPDYCALPAPPAPPTSPAGGAAAAAAAAAAAPAPGSGVSAVNAWLGPGGTTTPLHTDPQHNLLCQVLGRKYVRLYGPECGPALRPCESGLTTNSSRLELDDAADAAAASALPFLEGVLSPGASLFIPPGWWHYVRSLSPSISVSFWWS